MAQQATIVVLLLVFVGAIFIHYMLTNIEPFKVKKQSQKKRLGKKLSGKKRSGKKLSGKRRSGKSLSGKRLSGKRLSRMKYPRKKRSGKRLSGKSRSGKSRLGKRRSGKSRSGKRRSGKSRSGKRLSRMNYPRKKHSGKRSIYSGMKFSDVVGSLLSPSLPDSRDLKDKLHAAVEQSVDTTVTSTPNCIKPRDTRGCVPSKPTKQFNPSGSCASPDNGIASDAMPYNIDLNDYIKKDSIPCYGCNI